MKIKYKLLVIFNQKKCYKLFSQHKCPLCEKGPMISLPSAPGWFDTWRCVSCRLDWDDANAGWMEIQAVPSRVPDGYQW